SGSASASATASSSSSSSSVTSFPRSETLYTSGTAYSAPSNWNPLDTGNYSTGTQGLIYEPLFLYNPLSTSSAPYIPWLATSGGWNSANTVYTINVRSGVSWSDGTPLTGADVAYSINLARTNT